MTELPIYVRLDPVALNIGPLPVHWYGIMYLLAFLAFWLLGKYRADKIPALGWRSNEPGDYLFYAMLGVILGGRVGYVLFYNLGALLSDPTFLFRINQGGMSFHGGFLGVLLAVVIWSRFNRTSSFWEVTDLLAISAPIGLFFGRIANFINGELYGRPTDLPWAMRFPTFGPNGVRDQWTEPRHPSQLYESFLEGLVLLIVLNWLWRKSAIRAQAGVVTGAFIAGYGFFRFMVEFVRKPDNGIEAGFFKFAGLGAFTTGQELSFPMIIVGVALILWRRNKAVEVKAAP